MRKFFNNILPESLFKFLKDYFWPRYVLSYSQDGEDMILRSVFADKKKGFYVDVGAHHPKRFSNTYYFYKLGWTGINIDPLPGSMNIFNKIRSNDINIEKAISLKKQILTYYMFNESALNGFSKELSEKRYKGDNNQYSLESTIDLETVTLEHILNQNLPEDQRIDFLSIDVEGLDFDVLRSNNFIKFRPKVILIEILGKHFDEILQSDIANFLSNYDYEFYSKSARTVFFICSSFNRKRSNLL